VHRGMKTESANLQSIFDYPRAPIGQGGKTGKPLPGVSECKPTGDPCIYLSVLAVGCIQPGGPLNRLAGAQDFRDFSCLPSVEENRTQPTDPAPIAHDFLPAD
jgi:hypothetical protein